MEKLRLVITDIEKIGFLHTGILKSLNNSKLTTKSENDDMIIRKKKYFPKVRYFEEYKKMFNHQEIDTVCCNSSFPIRF
jgi:hypothetical protein